jgi:hypothetical protein
MAIVKGKSEADKDVCCSVAGAAKTNSLPTTRLAGEPGVVR